MCCAGGYDRFLTEYAKSVIKFKAWQLSRRSGFNRSEQGDLEQELWLSVLKEARRFDPQRASLDTFVDRVANTAAGMIVRRRSRLKRAPGNGVVSLDATKTSPSGESKRPRAESVSQEDLSRRTGAVSGDDAAAREDTEAVAHALRAMPEEVRDVCRRVMGGSISSAARDLGMSRQKIREVLQTARPYIERAGLGNR